MDRITQKSAYPHFPQLTMFSALSVDSPSSMTQMQNVFELLWQRPLFSGPAIFAASLTVGLIVIKAVIKFTAKD